MPLELLRFWTAAVVFVYFLQAYRHAGEFTDPEGLIDHRLCAKLLPATRWSLFQPWMPRRVFRAVYLCACAAAVLVALGVRPRAFALVLFAAAVSTYRWNALVAYLDDCIVHVFCLWLVLLPVGHAPAAGSDAGALAATVPGAAPRAFMANMALVYLVAGAYKFTSPMWRNGTATHAALKTPVSRAPGFWTLRHRSVLRAANYAALLLEPFFGLVFVLPPGSPAKWFLGACAAFFHLGIVATLKIPYANLLMLGGLATAFGPEIAHAASPQVGPETAHAASPQVGPEIARPASPQVGPEVARPASPRFGPELRPEAGPATTGPTGPLDPLDPSAIAALLLVTALAAMFAWEAAGKRRPISRPYSAPGRPFASGPRARPARLPWRPPGRRDRLLAGWANPLRFVLWLAGVFQSYRLFDWVDSRNYHVRYELRRAARGSTQGQALDAGLLFPDAMRHLLLQSYLLGNVWLQMSPEALAAVRRSILSRYAARYARFHPNAGTLEAWAIVQRVTSDNLDLARGERRFLMRFSCRHGVAAIDDLGTTAGDPASLRGRDGPEAPDGDPARSGSNRPIPAPTAT